MSKNKAANNRSVSIGGNVSGSGIVTGDSNVVNVTYQKITLPDPGSKISLMLYDTDADYIGRITTTAITAGWHQVTGTYDGSNSNAGIKVFVDGVEQATNNYSLGTYDGIQGAETSSSVNKNVDYLVIGTLASSDWLYTSHGRKIEKALLLKREGNDILIITERTLLKFTR